MAKKKITVLAGDNPKLSPSPREWQLIRMASANEADRLRDLVEPCQNELLDVTVRFVGGLDVGEATEVMRATSPSAKAVLALALQLLGDRTRKLLSLAIRRENVLKDTRIDEELETEAEQILTLLTTRSATAQRGSVTGDVTVELLARKGKPIKKGRAA